MSPKLMPSFASGSKKIQAAFTLVEVMVALTILSLIMLATLTGLRTLGNTQVAIDRLTGRVDEMRTVSSFLRDALEATVVGQVAGRLSLGGGQREKTFFQMSEDYVAWKSAVLFGEGYGGAHFLRVAREDDHLVLRWQLPNRNGQAKDWAQANSRVLIKNLEEFKVSYRQEFATPWVEEWSGQIDQPPDLVRLQVRTAGRFWPDLIFRVHKVSR